ncbi:hypothetical protein DFH08DRAFT_724262 [Mycena albidolilacea]|uniref:Uncharacterized protein n=1 Tax=Mycena albidolilacea TaxID=1033008 RepID=A0AAD7E791_9AGAR|nr:hypothetical protein DFH08DRAFT_724262 [Mycena albidolilacea]
MCLAISPGLILDKLVPDSELTIDSSPPVNPGLLEAVCQAGKELPYVYEMITALFTGCAEGWRQFTSEFVCGGPIDTLPDSLQHLVAIPATNDSNEGILGSMHVAARFHPNISTSNFSTRKWLRRNDTENFIQRLMMEPEDHSYTRQRVREGGASGKNRRFNLEVAERIATKGREARGSVAQAGTACSSRTGAGPCQGEHHDCRQATGSTSHLQIHC